MTIELTDSQLENARRLGSATLHEAAGKIGALPSMIKPLRYDWRIAAPVFAVVGPPQDNLWLHHAIYAAPKGSVLLHECGGDAEAGYWGGIMANASIVRGLAGFVTDGGVRDSEELRGLDWPVFARNVCIRGTSKRTDGSGSIGASVRIGDVVAFTGDLLVADADGVVIIPRAKADHVIEKGNERETHEREVVKQLKEGKTTLDLLKFPDVYGIGVPAKRAEVANV
ncbi:RraA family protein [Paraburkholderia sp. ZP32-5]|uniref:RraA family protein n=1 Tax=Paraburkholderia sp. ZP32-5 TaxID=2883245 RepID=UPI001F340B5C|nr:RraA family protein [Paraburkholderia sp. ZP32-5]